MRHLGIKFTERDKISQLFNYDTLDEFYAALGYGGVTTQRIAPKLAPEQQEVAKPTEATPAKKTVSSIRVLGAGDMLASLAQCCNPVPGDEIIGYVTRSRGVSIHRKDCLNIINDEEKERSSRSIGDKPVLPIR